MDNYIIRLPKNTFRALVEKRKTQIRFVNCHPESMEPDPVDHPCPYGKIGDHLMALEDTEQHHAQMLEIVTVSTDKLWNISPEDILKEGIQCPFHTYKNPALTKATNCKGAPSECPGPRQEMIETWDRDHPDFPWNMNPWVWVVTFKLLS